VNEAPKESHEGVGQEMVVIKGKKNSCVPAIQVNLVEKVATEFILQHLNCHSVLNFFAINLASYHHSHFLHSNFF